MPQNSNQVSFFPRVDWLFSPRDGAIESAVLVEGASLFVVWWKASLCWQCKNAEKE